jgi:hypothetical protein
MHTRAHIHAHTRTSKSPHTHSAGTDAHSRLPFPPPPHGGGGVWRRPRVAEKNTPLLFSRPGAGVRVSGGESDGWGKALLRGARPVAPPPRAECPPRLCSCSCFPPAAAPQHANKRGAEGEGRPEHAQIDTHTRTARPPFPFHAATAPSPTLLPLGIVRDLGRPDLDRFRESRESQREKRERGERASRPEESERVTDGAPHLGRKRDAPPITRYHPSSPSTHTKSLFGGGTFPPLENAFVLIFFLVASPASLVFPSPPRRALSPPFFPSALSLSPTPFVKPCRSEPSQHIHTPL